LQIGVLFDSLDGSQLTIRNVLLPVRRGELHAVAFGETTHRFTVERHALQAARIVADLLTAFAPDREQVFSCLDTFHACVFAGFDAMRLAAFEAGNQTYQILRSRRNPLKRSKLQQIEASRFLLHSSPFVCSLSELSSICTTFLLRSNGAGRARRPDLLVRSRTQ